MSLKVLKGWGGLDYDWKPKTDELYTNHMISRFEDSK